MKIQLTEADEKIVAASLKSGRYGSAEEAIHDVIWMLTLPAPGQLADDAWRNWAAEGIAAEQEGGFIDGPTAMASLRAELIERYGER